MASGSIDPFYASYLPWAYIYLVPVLRGTLVSKAFVQTIWGRVQYLSVTFLWSWLHLLNLVKSSNLVKLRVFPERSCHLFISMELLLKLVLFRDLLLLLNCEFLIIIFLLSHFSFSLRGLKRVIVCFRCLDSIALAVVTLMLCICLELIYKCAWSFLSLVLLRMPSLRIRASI